MLSQIDFAGGLPASAAGIRVIQTSACGALGANPNTDSVLSSHMIKNKDHHKTSLVFIH